MAEDDKDAKDKSDDKEGGAGGKKKLIVIAAASVALLLAGAGAGFVFMSGSKEEPAEEAKADDAKDSEKEDAKDEDEAEEHADEESADEEHAKKDEDEEESHGEEAEELEDHGAASHGEGEAAAGNMYELETFIVNITDRDHDRYLKIKAELELSSDKVAAELDKRTPHVRDIVISLLGSKSFEEIRSIEGKDLLREEMLQRINALLTTGKAQQIFFTEFVVQ